MLSEQKPSDPSAERIEKMLEESRVKSVPPQILKGFKDDVMRRIEAERAAKPAPNRWFAPGWKLPRIGMSVGAGAFACLVIAVLSTLSVRPPAQTPPQTPVKQTAANGFAPANVPAQPRRLTVEEQLRLIEEFDDRRFFIRQDISNDDPAAA